MISIMELVVQISELDFQRDVVFTKSEFLDKVELKVDIVDGSAKYLFYIDIVA